jgi:hypothetical protein
VRGTAWYVEDRCDGTLTRVSKGSVSVYDRGRHRTVWCAPATAISRAPYARAVNVAGRRRSGPWPSSWRASSPPAWPAPPTSGACSPGLEQESLLQRFERRDARPAPNMLVVAVDDKTFADLQLQWPFPRRWHARAIDRLRRDGARVIVYDVQFTEQTTARDDNALIDADRPSARRRARPPAETDEHGGTNVLGGAAALKSIGAPGGGEQPARGPRRRAAARRVRARRPADAGHRRRAALGRPPARRRSTRTAPGSTSTARRGRSTPSRSPTCSPARSTRARARAHRGRRRGVADAAGRPPDADERHAHVGPRDRGQRDRHRAARHAAARTPRWAGLLIVLALGFLPALVSLRLRAAGGGAVVPAIAFVFLLIAQRAFEHGPHPARRHAALRARAGHREHDLRRLRHRAPPAQPRHARNVELEEA